MNHLPHLVELFFNLGPGQFKASLAQVDRVGQQRAARLDPLGSALFYLDSPIFQKASEVFVEFVFVDWFIVFCLFLRATSQSGVH